MTDFDETGEIIKNLPITTSDPWKDRLQASYREMAQKSVPAVLAFAAEVKAFNDDCTERKQGGSTFTMMAQHWLGMSQASVSKWLNVGETSKLIRSANNLPPAMETIYTLAKLPTRKFTECIKDGRINPMMTRAEATALKPASTRAPSTKNVRSNEEVFKDRMTTIINEVSLMNETEQQKALTEISNFINNTGEFNE